MHKYVCGCLCLLNFDEINRLQNQNSVLELAYFNKIQIHRDKK